MSELIVKIRKRIFKIFCWVFPKIHNHIENEIDSAWHDGFGEGLKSSEKDAITYKLYLCCFVLRLEMAIDFDVFKWYINEFKQKRERYFKLRKGAIMYENH